MVYTCLVFLKLLCPPRGQCTLDRNVYQLLIMNIESALARTPLSSNLSSGFTEAVPLFCSHCLHLDAYYLVHLVLRLLSSSVI